MQSWLCDAGCRCAAALLVAGAISIGPPAWLGAQTIQTIAGTGQPSNNGDEGPALELNVGDPFGVELGPDGGLYICEVRNHRILRLDLKQGTLRTVVGSGQKGYAGDGGPPRKAQLNEPYEVRFDTAGNLYWVEMQNHVVRKLDARTQTVHTVAGTGQRGFSGDGGPAKAAQLSIPHSIALDTAGNLYIADIGNHRIRKVDAATGIITTIAGNGQRQLPVEGQPAADRPLLGPRALVVDGNVLWIALREGHAVWKMDLASGILRHVAGTGERGFSGDGGPATSAQLDGPKGIALGPDRCLYVADTENHAIRKIDLTRGTIHTVAGRGREHRGYGGDGGPAHQALLDRPHGVCVGPDGTIYVGDSLNHRVRRIR
jgi:sugar lactone lactonase YvrE